MIAAFTSCLPAAVDQSIIDNTIMMSGVDVFAHVWVQALDSLSNFCDDNNIHSAIWMKLSFFDKCDTSFNFILQFYNKFELLNSQR